MCEESPAAAKQSDGKGGDLSMVTRLVNVSAAATAVNGEPGKRPIFQLHLPATQKTSVDARTQLGPEKSRGQGERILFVDDDEAMVFLMERWLERLGYKVTGCTLPEKALAMFRSAPQDFDIVITDFSMPHMSGIEFAREILQIRPGMPILIASGYVNPADNEEVRSLGLPDLILKSNSIEELGHTIHSIFANCKSADPAEKTRSASNLATAAGS
jgi:CheY-like chemotaxis protein